MNADSDRHRVDFFIPGEESPRVVDSAGQMGDAFGAFLAESDGANPARLYHRARPTLPNGGVDHELLVAVVPGRGVGALRFGADGTWFTRGTAPPEQIATAGAMYGFPDDSEVPLDLVRVALMEFFETHERPMAIEWQHDPHDF